MGEFGFMQMLVLGGHKAGKSPALPSKLSLLEWEIAWFWMQNWALKRELSSKHYMPEGRISTGDGGLRFAEPLCLVHITLLFLWYIAVSSPWFWLKKDKRSCREKENVKREGKLIQYRSKNSYFSLTYYLRHSSPPTSFHHLSPSFPFPSRFLYLLHAKTPLSPLHS